MLPSRHENRALWQDPIQDWSSQIFTQSCKFAKHWFSQSFAFSCASHVSLYFGKFSNSRNCWANPTPTKNKILIFIMKMILNMNLETFSILWNRTHGNILKNIKNWNIENLFCDEMVRKLQNVRIFA